MRMCVSCACLVPGDPEEGIRSSGTGVADGSEPPCRCCELNLRLLQEHPVRLNTGLPCLLNPLVC